MSQQLLLTRIAETACEDGGGDLVGGDTTDEVIQPVFARKLTSIPSSYRYDAAVGGEAAHSRLTSTRVS